MTTDSPRRALTTAGTGERAGAPRERSGEAATPQDGRLRRMLADLAPWLALSADLRSVGCEPRQPGGGVPELTSSEAASATGDLAKARAVSSRLARVPQPTRAVVEELALYARAQVSFEALALHYALARAPVKMREALDKADTKALDTARELTYARTREAASKRAPTTESLTKGHADVASARDADDSARARAAAAKGALQAWGEAALTVAIEAWEETGRLR